MIRRAPLKRRRPKASEPRVKGRPALSEAAWRALVADLKRRAGYRCEVPWCRRGGAVSMPLDPHHVVPCSMGGADDPRNILIVCGGPAGCHARFDVSYQQGKLVAEPLGGERFRVALEWRRDKRSPLLDGSMQEIVERRG